MTSQEIDVCCTDCRMVICAAKNEWKRVGCSFLAPIQKTWHNTFKVATGQEFPALEHLPESLRWESVSEASCGHCGKVLGHGFRDVGSMDPMVYSDQIFFFEPAIFQKSSNLGCELAIVTDHSQASRMFPSCGESEPATSPKRSQTCAEVWEAQKISKRFAQQGTDIKNISKILKSLQDRMHALEKSMINAHRSFRAPSANASRMEQDVLIDNFEAIFAAIKDARGAERTMQDLRSENEQLKRRLHSAEAPISGELGDESSRSADGTTSKTLTDPSLDVRRKTPYTQRKPRATQKENTPTASDFVDPVSSFASKHDQDDASQLGSLTALKEIAAAMAQSSSMSQTQMPNHLVQHEFGGHSDGNLASDLSHGNNAFSNENGPPPNQPKKRRRTRDGMLGDGNKSEPNAPTKNATDTIDSPQTRNSLDQFHKELRRTAGLSTLQGEEHHWPRSQNEATPFEVAGTEDMMIDPTLLSTSVSDNRCLPAPDVLSSIENLPNQRQTRKIAQPEKTTWAPQYDSVHEARIREYKARDALRKRKSRAESIEKKKMVGEDKFKKEEKIRARDRMVKELMEREEMFEDDGDL